jgi:hypothetical protein
LAAKASDEGLALPDNGPDPFPALAPAPLMLEEMFLVRSHAAIASSTSAREKTWPL